MLHGLHRPFGFRPRDSTKLEHHPLAGALQCSPGSDARRRELTRARVQVGGRPADRLRPRQGPYAWDVDDNKYIDYIGSWGPAICGHAHPEVISALQETLEKGTSFGAPCSLRTPWRKW